MKKLFSLLICGVVIFSACGGQSETAEKKLVSSSSGVEDILKSAENSSTELETFDITVQKIPDNPSDLIPKLDYDAELDLTSMNSTMVYSEVYNMMNTPDDYIGKSVKATGSFSVFTDIKTGKYYYSCVIADATACCQQGLEFVLAEERKYPDEFPTQGRQITVAGVFDTYEEDGNTYCCLNDAELSF